MDSSEWTNPQRSNTGAAIEGLWKKKKEKEKKTSKIWQCVCELVNGSGVSSGVTRWWLQYINKYQLTQINDI